MLLKKIALLFYSLLFSAVAQADINIRVINQNADFTDTNTFLRFESDPNNLSGTLNHAGLIAKKPYSFAEAKSGILLHSNLGGRIFFSLGAPLTDTLTPPESNNPSIPSYHTRFDKIELTYDPNNPYSVANLTIIDFFSIPLCLKTYKEGRLVNSLDLFVDGETMIHNLAQLTHCSAQAVITEKGKFLRVLGPPNQNISSLYPSMQEYIESLKLAAHAFQIKDYYYHDGETPEMTTQEYSFWGSIDDNNALILQGGSDILGYGHTITIDYNDLLQGIYGCNPTYLVDGALSSIGQNDVYSAVVRDTVAGFNLGFIGSTAVNPATGLVIKDSPSCDWKQCPQAFEFLQPFKPFYNQWGRYVSEHSNSYSFPFSDLWQKVQISLTNIDTLEIIIKPDAPSYQPYFLTNFIKREIPRAVNKIFGNQISKTG